MHWTTNLKRTLNALLHEQERKAQTMEKNGTDQLTCKLGCTDPATCPHKLVDQERITGTDGHTYHKTVRVSCIQCGKLATPDKASHIGGSVEWTCHTCHPPKGTDQEQEAYNQDLNIPGIHDCKYDANGHTPDGFKVGSGNVIAGAMTQVTLEDKTESMKTMKTVDCNITMEFIKAGKAIFTVDNGKGTHYTYKVTRKEDKGKVFYFVNLLTGPDNTSNYTYMGMLVDDHLWNRQAIQKNLPSRVYCKMTKASKYNTDSKPVKVFNWAMDVVMKHNELPQGYSILHDGRCARCGRTLTDPESIKTGLGPVCRDLTY
jgi:hypothetical protein